MSVQRVFAPLASSSPSSLVFRFASPTSSSLRPCQHVLRLFSSAHSAQTSSKRKMQTSTAYQPYSLDSQPPPPLQPRNTGIPDTSISGGTPEVNNTRPPKQTGQYEMPVGEPAKETTSISLTEQEAQKSKPTTAPRSKPRPKLRARKAPIKLTSGAVKQLQDLLNQPNPKLIKVGVRNRGCSGLSYHLEYVDKPGMFDEQVEQDGVKVLVDSKALFSIIGSEMDWVEDKLSQRFVFSNPNTKEQCGCGESFMV
ncbi:uncharacterized protein BP5553_03570 [Venustampulla echinocandica]|uniref:Iron-sulfur assembly protein 1 n=1 Tax=Venustampulla echinocandica TaxID=2656787 RepID=A0A370TUQ2_9HELO|nr:uncharacterized protein BP5553_03570 [Venustampulla echinocandica]RDL39230.1 hypothetical protein BP5553_03570 [Venustampulla echinocandica]